MQQLVFPRGSFTGTKYITMTNDDEYCAVRPLVHQWYFTNHAIFNINIYRSKSIGINPSTVKFAYLAADGSVQYAANDGIVVDLATGNFK